MAQKGRLVQIAQPARGYAYNSDSLFLYDFALSFISDGNHLLDVGSGSGVIGLLCARDRQVSLTMIEKSADMAFFSQRNARVGGFSAEVIHADFLGLTPSKPNSFDVAISNPPFYHARHLKSPNPITYNARYEENLPFEALLAKLKQFLKPKGSFVFCYDSRESDRVFEALLRNHFKAEVVRYVYPCSTKDATLFLCKAQLNSKKSTRFLPPLYVYECQQYSAEVQRIYSTINTHSIKAEL